MTPTAQPVAPPQPHAVPASTNFRKAVSARSLASPLVAVILLLALLALAASGAMTATRTISGHISAYRPDPLPPTGSATATATVDAYRIAFTAPGPIRHTSVEDVDLAGLFVRGQPMRWSAAQAKAVAEEEAGQNYNQSNYRAAMKAAQYNQKNGWTDDGEERTSKGTPLRNNQKREGNNGSCLQSFSLTAPVCGEGSEDVGGGDAENPLESGGIEFETP
jgi:hypothetical protein